MDSPAQAIEAKPLSVSYERPVWNGRPQQGLVFRSTDLITVTLGAMCLAFSVGWTYVAAGANTGYWMRLLLIATGGTFIAYAAYMCVGHYALDAFRRRHTHYQITEAGVHIATWGTTKLIPWEAIDRRELRLHLHANGRGTIVLRRDDVAYYLSAAGRWYRGDVLERVEDPQGVLGVIRDELSRRA